MLGRAGASDRAAEACGARVCLHPDDPPFSLFGLPRVVSTKADYAALFDAVPSPANGITLCAGSLGSRVDNDVMAIASAFADRVHFVHLRNVTIQAGGAFFEDDHLEVHALLESSAASLESGDMEAKIAWLENHK